MIDIHTHLHFKDYDADRDETIKRAREAGVEKMILVGTDLESSRAAIALAEKHAFLYASVGVHPHEFNQSTVNSQQKTVSFRVSLRVEESAKSETDPSTPLGMTDWKNELKELAKHPKVVAIGECGLDYFSRDPEKPITEQQREIQKAGFLTQMEIADELGLPMIIHTRPSAGTMDAYEDLFGILRDESLKAISYKLKAVLHCYQGDTDVTKKFLELPNVFFSFAGSITYPVKQSLVGTKDDPAEVVKLVPPDRIFVETDCPYLAPQSVRGTRNEPAYVRMTTQRVAEVRGVELGKLERSMEQGFAMVFGRSKIGG